MEHKTDTHHTCTVCGKSFALKSLVPGDSLRDVIAAEISRDHPQWSAASFICYADLSHYRGQYVQSLDNPKKSYRF